MTFPVVRAVRTRIGQVGYAVAARWTRPTSEPLQLLSPAELALFMALPLADRQHGLRVAQRLHQAGYDLAMRGEGSRPLVKAALLHDIGKAGQGIRLVHRVAHVLLSRWAPGVWRRITASPTGWRRPLYALANHADLGAIWLTEAGSDPLTIALVRHHEAHDIPPDLLEQANLLRALQQADDGG